MSGPDSERSDPIKPNSSQSLAQAFINSKKFSAGSFLT